jgi:hypothetical protein
MSTTTQTYPESRRREMTAARVVRGGSLASGVAGALTVLLAILGLSSIMPGMMIPLAVIALGAAFLFEGGAIAARFSDFLTETSKSRRDVPKLGAGVTIEVAGGVIGAILGILSILRVLPAVLTPVAILVYGTTLIFGSGVATWFDSLLTARSGEHETFNKTAHDAVMVSAGLQFILGVTGVILGILALVGISPVIMSLSALLCIGFAALVTGTAISVRMSSIMLRSV